METVAASANFDKGLPDPAGDHWPFERAQLRLDYGEWLRQRRINNAKPVLAAALETFRHLGASPWIRRAEAELRACGISDVAVPAAHDALTKLTAQQHEIVILAGRGLTNAEIADRLFLSPAPSPPTCTAPTRNPASPAATDSATSPHRRRSTANSVRSRLSGAAPVSSGAAG